MIWDKWYDPSIGANGKSSISTGITETLAFDLAFDLAFELEFETLESRALLQSSIEPSVIESWSGVALC